MTDEKKLNFYYIDYSKLNHIKDKLFNKNGRKYFVSIKLDNDYHGLVPLKSNLNHSYGIKSIHGNGLDLHKVIIIHDKDLNSILKSKALISNSEYNVLYRKQDIFKTKFNDCVNDYIEALALPKSERSRIQTNLITHTTLKNYHNELNIDRRVEIAVEKLKNQEVAIPDKAATSKFSVSGLKQSQETIDRETKPTTEKKKTIL